MFRCLSFSLIFFLAFLFSSVLPVLAQNPDSIPFAPQVTYGTGGNPASVFVADLDGDGDKDLAVANFSGGGYDSVSILKNNGDGTFQLPVKYESRDQPTSVFCADLDGDGYLDIACANQGGYVSIFKNNGDGTFQTKVDYYAGSWLCAIFCADLDGDADLDIVVGPYQITGGMVSVFMLRNNGDATFSSQVIYVASHIYSIFCADFDKDLDNDIAVVGDGRLTILKNNGDGTFPWPDTYYEFEYATSVYGGDFDSDSDIDLAVTDAITNTVSIFKNNGNATFQRVDYTVGLYPASVFAADFDGDSDLDLAVTYYSYEATNDTLSILKNNGDGTFQSRINYKVGVNLMSNFYTPGLFCADLDEDTDIDIAATNFNDGTVSILLNLSHPRWEITAGPNITAFARTQVPVALYVHNTGIYPDSCSLVISDSLGWDIQPDNYKVALNAGEIDTLSFNVWIPNVPIGTKNKITLIGTSLTNPSVVDTTFLYVTCSSYNLTLTKISDFPYDQGKEIRLDWSSFPSADPLVKDFNVFRRIDYSLAKSIISDQTGNTFKNYPPGQWQWLATIPAFGETLYSAVAPTVKDSTISEGMYWSVFFVRAGTDTPTVYFDSPVDSGYSLDNLSPTAPTGLLASCKQAKTKLNWSKVGDVDFNYFTLYRDTLNGFSPDLSNRKGFTVDTTFSDSTANLGVTYYYLVSAIDFSGNESNPSNQAMAIRYILGDVNIDAIVDIADIVYVINYVFYGGTEPVPLQSGDVNCDEIMDIADIVYLINYVFYSGTEPNCQ
jgi:hypothetical protein